MKINLKSRMKTHPTHRVALVAAALLGAACVTPTETHDLDDHGVEITLNGEELRNTFSLEEGYYVSPPLTVESGASRVAAMVTLSDVPPDLRGRLHARAVRDDGTFTAWMPLEVTFEEEELRVIRADLPETALQVQLRVAEEDADLVRLITWTGTIPEAEGEDAADDGNITVSNSGGSAQQGLDGDLAGAGVLPRSAWGARPHRCSTRDRAKVRAAVHHTAGPVTSGGSYEAALRQIQAYHMDGRGYCDAGYHFAVTLDGRVWELRPVQYQGGHSGNYNGGNAGVVMVGCFDAAACGNISGPRVPSDAMVEGVGRVVGAVSRKFGFAVNADTVKGHGQQPHQQTGCPGAGGREKMETIRSLARNGGTPAPQPEPPPPTGDNSCGRVEANTSGTPLNIRPAASTAGAAVGTLADGARADRLSSVQGQSVNGNRTWHRIRRTDGLTGFVSAAYSRCIAVAAPAPSNPAPAPTTTAPASCTFMGPGQALAPNQAVTSCNGRYSLVHQGDGNVVLYNTVSGAAVWHTATAGRATQQLAMQGDGNLVLYSSTGAALWHTRTNGMPGATLAVQDDGNAVIYAPGNRAVWSTSTAGR